MSDGVTTLTYFEPIYMQDISPYRISRPCGWRGPASGQAVLDGLARATAVHPNIRCAHIFTGQLL